MRKNKKVASILRVGKRSQLQVLSEVIHPDMCEEDRFLRDDKEL